MGAGEQPPPVGAVRADRSAQIHFEPKTNKEANSYCCEFASFLFITQPTGRGKPLPYATSQRFLSAQQRPREEIGQDGLQAGLADLDAVRVVFIAAKELIVLIKEPDHIGPAAPSRQAVLRSDGHVV